jgi:hypothetical protein
MLAMCVNKDWVQIIKKCRVIAEHMMEMSGINKTKGAAYEKYHVKALDKTFGIRRTRTNIILFGKYWEIKRTEVMSAETLRSDDPAYFILDNANVWI